MRGADCRAVMDDSIRQCRQYCLCRLHAVAYNIASRTSSPYFKKKQKQKKTATKKKLKLYFLRVFSHHPPTVKDQSKYAVLFTLGKIARSHTYTYTFVSVVKRQLSSRSSSKQTDYYLSAAGEQGKRMLKKTYLRNQFYLYHEFADAPARRFYS